MENKPRRLEPLPPAQVGLLALAVLLLAVLVGSASRPGIGGPAAPPSSPETALALLRAGAILLVMLEAGVLLLAAWALWPGEGGRRTWRVNRQRWFLVVAAYLQSAVILVGLWLYLHFRSGPKTGTIGTISGIGLRPPSILLPSTAGASAAGEEWLTVLIVAAVVLVAGGLLVRTVLLRRDHRRSPAARLALRLQEALDEGLEELESEPDPRRAVIAAYARMERSLAGAGLPRRPQETGLEYLQRLFERLELTGPAPSRLTELFQLAKFSQHPVDEAMKRQAIDALSAVRADLAAIASPGSPVPVPA